MRIEINVPPFSESISEGKLLKWNKHPGEKVSRGEPIAELETEKVVLEVSAPEDGTLAETLKQEGDTVEAGERLAIMETSVNAEPTPPALPVTPPAAPPNIPSPAQVEAPLAFPAPVVGEAPMPQSIPMAEAAPAAPVIVPRPVLPEEAVTPSARREERRVPVSRIRIRIAERLKQAQNTAAILTTFNELDMSAVLALRKRYGEAFQQRYGIKLGLMSFFVQASVEALKRFPIVNASLEGDAIVYHDYYDLGIAVSSERGLVVPVLKEADQLSLASIEKAIASFAEKARAHTLTLEELTGGTFTITNGGVFGSMLSTPILNPPQSAILGMHTITKRAVAVDDQVMIRPMMYLALSYDHRLIDGREAVLFLVAVKNLLEDPARFLLGL